MRMLQRRFAVQDFFPNCCILVPIALPYLLISRVTEKTKQNGTQYIQGIGIIEGLLLSG